MTAFSGKRGGELGTRLVCQQDKTEQYCANDSREHPGRNCSTVPCGKWGVLEAE